MSNQDEMWLERKSVSQEIGFSVPAPFSVLAEYAKASFPSKILIGISNDSLFLKSLAYIYLCVYNHMLILIHTHTRIHRCIFISHHIYFTTTSKCSNFSLLPVSLSHTIPLSLAASPPIQTTFCLACTAPWDLQD